MSTEYFRCGCGTSGLIVEWYDEEKPEFDELWISTWQYGMGNHISIRDKLRSIWRIIRYGTAYANMVSLSKEDVKKLITVLSKGLNRID